MVLSEDESYTNVFLMFKITLSQGLINVISNDAYKVTVTVRQHLIAHSRQRMRFVVIR